MLYGILEALAGGATKVYKRDPQTGEMTETAVEPKPGEIAKRIIAGALVGAAGGAGQHGPGAAANGFARGAGARIAMDAHQQQQRVEMANDDFATQQKATLEKFQIAKLNHDVAKSSWEMTQAKAGLAMKGAAAENAFRALVSGDPQNEDFGTYASFDDFLEKHGGNGGEIGRMNANGELRAIPAFDKDGNLAGVHVARIARGWGQQKNAEPVKMPFYRLGAKGKAEQYMETIPAGSKTNDEILTLMQASGKQAIDLAKNENSNQTKLTIATENNQTKEHVAGENNQAKVKIAEMNDKTKTAVAQLQGQIKRETAAGGKLSASTQSMVDAAPHVLELADRLEANLAKIEAGPLASRYQEFMAGKLGAPNPDFIKYRTDAGLLQTLLMRMHVGARGSKEIMNHFKEMLDAGKQSPENMHAAIEEIRIYAKDVAASGQRQPAAGAGTPTTPAAGGQGGEVTAIGPNGHKIVVRNGKWVDAQTGAPIQ